MFAIRVRNLEPALFQFGIWNQRYRIPEISAIRFQDSGIQPSPRPPEMAFRYGFTWKSCGSTHTDLTNISVWRKPDRRK